MKTKILVFEDLKCAVYWFYKIIEVLPKDKIKVSRINLTIKIENKINLRFISQYSYEFNMITVGTKGQDIFMWVEYNLKQNFEKTMKEILKEYENKIDK